MTSQDFLNIFQTFSTDQLPGIRSHQKLAPISRPLDLTKVSNRENYRKSAVSIVCHIHEDELSFVLIQRPEYKGAHSGQVAFPGGKKEEQDSDLIQTAIRETHEEIGLKLLPNELILPLSEIFIPVSKFIVQPYLFYREELESFTLEEREVADTFQVKIIDLITDTNLKRTNIRIANGTMLKHIPFFELNGKVVWGATALILSEFKDILLNR